MYKFFGYGKLPYIDNVFLFKIHNLAKKKGTNECNKKFFKKIHKIHHILKEKI
jgi:hypothetical protein